MTQNKLFAPSPVHSHKQATGDDELAKTDNSDNCSFLSQGCPPPARDTPLSTFRVPITSPRRSSTNYKAELQARTEQDPTCPSTLERRQSEKESFNKMDTQLYKRQLSITTSSSEDLDSISVDSQPYSNNIRGQTSHLQEAKDKLDNFNKKIHGIDLPHPHFPLSHFRFGNEKGDNLGWELNKGKEITLNSDVEPASQTNICSEDPSTTEYHSFSRKKSFNFSDYRNNLLRKSVSGKSGVDH